MTKKFAGVTECKIDYQKRRSNIKVRRSRSWVKDIIRRSKVKVIKVKKRPFLIHD